MDTDAIRYAQRVLRDLGTYRGYIDGDPGPASLSAAGAVFAPRVPGWPAARQVIAAAQQLLTLAGFEPGPVDGLAGPQTAAAILEWDVKRAGGDPRGMRPDDEPEPRTGAPVWGVQRDMARRFGLPGDPACTAGEVRVPWRMVLAWDPPQVIRTIRCHEAVADSLGRVLGRVADAYAPETIQALGLDMFGGCFNYRRKRGGRTLSTHAWGLALDFDPVRNQLRWKSDRARLAQPDAGAWWRCWQAEGWLSLGQARDFDWMHVQAPGL